MALKKKLLLLRLLLLKLLLLKLHRWKLLLLKLLRWKLLLLTLLLLLLTLLLLLLLPSNTGLQRKAGLMAGFFTSVETDRAASSPQRDAPAAGYRQTG